MIYKLGFSSGTTVETTWNHPFYIQGRGFVETKDLKVGDKSHTANGALVAISSIHTENREETVYNFEVEGNHTYFVGDDDVLVHNQSAAYGAFDGSAAFNALLDKASAGIKNLFGKDKEKAQEASIMEDISSEGQKIKTDDYGNKYFVEDFPNGVKLYNYIDQDGKVTTSVSGSQITNDVGYGEKTKRYHSGADSGDIKKGTPLGAVDRGVVIGVQNDNVDGEKLPGGKIKSNTAYGNSVLILHENGVISRTAHGDANSIKVSVGQAVNRGDVITNAGQTGKSTGVHQHTEFMMIPPEKMNNYDMNKVLSRQQKLPIDDKPFLFIDPAKMDRNNPSKSPKFFQDNEYTKGLSKGKDLKKGFYEYKGK